MFSLLKKRRAWQDPEPTLYDRMWNLIPKTQLLNPGDFMLEGREIFKPIWGVVLEKEGAREKKEMINNFKLLGDLVARCV